MLVIIETGERDETGESDGGESNIRSEGRRGKWYTGQEKGGIVPGSR